MFYLMETLPERIYLQAVGPPGVVVTNKEIKDGEFVLMSKFAEENIDATGNMIKKTFEAVTGILCNPSGSMIDTFCNNFVYESITQDSSVINSQRVFRVKEKMVSSNTGKPLYRYNWYNEEGHLLGTTYHYGR